MHYNQKVGQFGENLAKNYLISHGYRIMDCNVKTSYKEIDIVAKYQKTLVFIEVKTRTSEKFGTADEAVSRRKISNLKKALNIYLYKNDLDENDVRLDLISIDINKNNKTAKIKHYKGII